MRYIIPATVSNVEEHFVPQYLGGIGDAAQFRDVSHGWFVYLEGSHEALGLGAERPALAKGDKVKITVEKVI